MLTQVSKSIQWSHQQRNWRNKMIKVGDKILIKEEYSKPIIGIVYKINKSGKIQYKSDSVTGICTSEAKYVSKLN